MFIKIYYIHRKVTVSLIEKLGLLALNSLGKSTITHCYADLTTFDVTHSIRRKENVKNGRQVSEDNQKVIFISNTGTLQLI